MMELDRTAADQAVRWYFYEEQPGCWRWDEVSAAGELLRRSDRAFANRADCVGHAKAHGYASSP